MISFRGQLGKEMTTVTRALQILVYVLVYIALCRQVVTRLYIVCVCVAEDQECVAPSQHIVMCVSSA